MSELSPYPTALNNPDTLPFDAQPLADGELFAQPDAAPAEWQWLADRDKGVYWDLPPTETAPAQQPAPEQHGRPGFWYSRLGRAAVAALTSIGLIGGISALEASPAQAATTKVYTITGTGGDGVWLHGKEQGGKTGYVTDRYTSSKWNRNNTLEQQGIPKCGAKTTAQKNGSSSSANKLQPAESPPSFSGYDRDKAVRWALQHAQDTPPDAGSCTWFVSKALWAGGVHETDIWNDNPHGLKRDGIIRLGTDYAWRTPDFLGYMRSLPFITVSPIDFRGDNENHLPKAKLGDLIIYDWDGKGSPDHATIITGFAKNNPQYPLVTGWSEDGSKPNKYKWRGWTWSEKSKNFIQLIKDPSGNYPYKNMTAYLIHIRTEDEINLN